ncbi:MAG: exodeoxyribonuclease VII small subunit [Propionicimonas sp.]|uniref:exodeoxyribonuclease VII small subunit n=1 Tax=Propionicimonas sp. TaxID=1955623 RepID=UPI003D152716
MSKEPELGYEAARDELVDVIRRLEAGSVPLSESMALWERGEKLAAICQQWLDGAKAKIDAARGQEQGQ